MPLTVRTASVAATTALVVVALIGSASAAPPAKPASGGAAAATKACIAAHEDAQTLRGKKKLHAAREKFVACARAECPTAVRKECVEQLSLVEKDAPTVVLEALDESGNATTAVKVTMDGAVVAEKLTGAAIDVEPGEHVFRFERADGKPIESRVLVAEGDKNRKVLADWAALVPKPPPTAMGPEKPAAEPIEKRSVPTGAWVLGGLGLAGFGAFTAMALVGKGKEHDLASSCSPRCTDAQLRPVKTDYLVADVSLGVGLVATAIAVILAWPAITGKPAVTTARSTP